MKLLETPETLLSGDKRVFCICNIVFGIWNIILAVKDFKFCIVFGIIMGISDIV